MPRHGAPDAAEHPNLAVVARVGEAISSGFAEPADDAIADDCVFLYYSARVPKLAGDHHGRDGLRRFFTKLQSASGGTFRAEPVSATAVGDELVVAHARIGLTLHGMDLEMDAPLVWRVVDGRVVEVWDIPAVNTPRVLGGSAGPQPG